MIDFQNSYVQEWRNKIIFAPNGFGKTTISKKLKAVLENNNPESVLLFTRKQMDNLLTFSKNEFYFGESAKQKLDNKTIEYNFKKTGMLKRIAKNYYDVTSASKFKDVSFFANIMELSNLYDTSLLAKREFESYKNDSDYTFNEAIEIDKILVNVYNSFCNIYPIDLLKAKAKKQYKYKIKISQVIYVYLCALKDYVINGNLVSCPLCGRNTSDTQKLINAINKKFKKYVIYSDDNPSDLINSAYEELSALRASKTNTIFLNIFACISNKYNVSFKDKINVLLNFVNLCNNNSNIILDNIKKQEINGTPIKDICDSYIKNTEIIEKVKKSMFRKTEILNYIIREFEKITHISREKIESDYENMSISLISFENKREAASEILSESECKRLSVAILKAKIRYGKYDCIILDDPVDSYDDYYLDIVCKYISNLVRERKLKRGFYIFTNNTSALYKLSINLNVSSIIIYENPDIVFSNTSNNLKSTDIKFLEITATPNDIKCINKSEINLLNIYLSTSSSSTRGVYMDIHLSFIAFLTSLRNIRDEVIKKVEKLSLINGKTNNTNAYDLLVKRVIEHNFMHYDPFAEKPTISEAYNVYKLLATPKNDLINALSTDNSSLPDKREQECLKPFDSHKGSKLLNLIFKKMIFVSELKFRFECLLLNKLSGKFNFTNAEISQIANVDKGLGKKISRAIGINKKMQRGAEVFLKKIHDIHYTHAQLVNEFDHGMSLMYPPYLNTRIYDILKYKLDLERIDGEF